MFKKQLNILASVVVLLSMIGYGSHVQAQKIAVVEVDHVFNQLDESNIIEVNIRNKAADLQAEENKKVKELELVNRNIEDKVYNVGTEAHTNLLLQAERLALELRVLRSYNKVVIEREAVLMLQDLYRRMEQTIQQMGREKGLDLILFADTIPDQRPQSQSDLMSLVMIRKVLYYNDQLNITNEVISRMNTAFKAGRSGS